MSKEKKPATAAAPSADALKRRDEDYYFVENIVGGFNKDCLEIKKWSVTTASIVGIVGQVGLSSLYPVLLTIAALALVFWITETIWRVNQWAFIRRVRQLERDDPAGPQVSRGWAHYYYGEHKAEQKSDKWDNADGESRPARVLAHFIAPRTSLPHGIIVVLALVLAGYFGPAETPEPHPDRVQIEGPVDLRVENRAAPAPENPVEAPQ